ncbi:MAG: hypothetical protein ACE5H3_00210 [Planctomycetota bacterium]
MRKPWRILGLAGLGAALLVLAAQMLFHKKTKSPARESLPVVLRPEVEGLGRVKAGFRGRIELEAENRIPDPAHPGRVRRVPAVRLLGFDPLPAPENRMKLQRVEIVFLGEDGNSETLAVKADAGTVALVPDAPTPEIDLSHALVLENPRELRIPGLLGGRNLLLEAESAEIDPYTRAVRNHGPFRLQVEGLEVEASNLTTDPEEGSLRFGGPGEAGRVRWKARTPAGEIFSGISDGGGSLVPAPGGSQILALPARKESELLFPDTSVFPGRLRSHGLKIRFEPGKEPGQTGWQPRRAEAGRPTHWLGSGAWLRGGRWTTLWDSAGVLEGVAIAGPLRGVHSEPSFGLVSARGGAWLVPFPKGDERPQKGKIGILKRAYLYEAVHLEGAEGSLAAERVIWAWDAPGVEAGGRVWMRGSQGMATCGALDPVPGGWWLREGAVAYPGQGLARVLTSPSLHIDEDGILEMEGGFLLSGWRAGEPWGLRGNVLRASDRAGLWRATAQGRIVWSSGATSFRGTGFFMHGEDHVELQGSPATARLEGDGEEDAGRTAQAERFTRNGKGLRLEGNPALGIPASALGLGEGLITVRAADIHRKEDGTWDLRGKEGVAFEGAVQGHAREADWAPGRELVLRERAGKRSFLKGTVPEEGAFTFQAQILKVHPEKGVRLEKGAEADLEPPQTADGEEPRVPIHLSGTRGSFSPTGGWFEGRARVEQGAWMGQGDRVTWSMEKGDLTLLELIRKAFLSGPGIQEARGDRILLRVKESRLRMEGRTGAPAYLLLEDGRSAWGTWLEFDHKEGLLSAAHGVFPGGGER